MKRYNNRNWFYLLILGTIFTVIACNFPQIKKEDEIVNTSIPPEVPEVMPVDIAPFQTIGCIWESENYAICPEGSIPKKMGCDSFSIPPEFLSLIDDESQFVQCSYAPLLQNPPDEGDSKGLYNSGCAIVAQQRLIAYKDGDYLLIRDIEDLKYYFSPIDSQDKALGYAIAATGFSPYYNFNQMENFRILVNELDPTHVQTTSDSYEINLFDNQICGCGPHTYFMNRVKVSFAGDIEILETIAVFENPEEDNLCVD
jgi:hypothetical protein